jgi:putative two-component system response regulator
MAISTVNYTSTAPKRLDYPTIPITSKRILLVENNVLVRQMLVKTLEIEGYNVLQASDGEAALRYMEQLTPDLIISDIQMPLLSGVELYKIVRDNSLWVAIPFIFLTSSASPEEIKRGRELGVEDYLVKPIDPDDLLRIVHARLLRSMELQVALIDQSYLETVDVLANTIEGRDPYTHGHVERVANYAQTLAEALGWSQELLRMLAFGARLHDIGKIIVPDHILKKPGRLTLDEWNLMKQHPTAGAKILHNIKHLQATVNYALYHHERWDGTGYPHGLKGREIPIEGRLLAIVDVFDALTTSRPYHPARPIDEVHKFLSLRAGTHFDPDLVNVFVDVLQKQQK